MEHFNECSNFACLTLVTCIPLKSASASLMTGRHTAETNELESGKTATQAHFKGCGVLIACCFM